MVQAAADAGVRLVERERSRVSIKLNGNTEGEREEREKNKRDYGYIGLHANISILGGCYAHSFKFIYLHL